MCGIVGKIALSSKATVDETLIRRMCGSIVHRGPDDEGVYVADGVGIGMRRLAIIDLKTGHQPISNESRSIWIVFNGEIYNFQDLRKQLASRHRFTTNTDTEAIVHLYEDYGCDALARLRGMFAFAIWDENRRELVLARDRVGKKPLYYTRTDDAFIFGSEIKAILQDASVPRRPMIPAIGQYITFGFCSSRDTLFEGISRLQPGEYLRLFAETGELRTEYYWRPDYTRQIPRDEPSAIREARERIEEAIAIRQVSDVPLGILLSGGVDSGVVTALSAQVQGRPVRTFTVGIADPARDERPLAQLVAKRYGTEHTTRVVEPASALALLPDIVWHFDEPIQDTSVLPTLQVCALAREAVTVALNGDGGDEAFGGYQHYLTDRIVQAAAFAPRPLLVALARVLEATGHHRAQAYAVHCRIAHYDTARRWLERRGMPLSLRQALCTPLLASASEALAVVPQELLQAAHEVSGTDDLTQWMYFDFVFWLQGNLLVKMDRASMAHGLETRSPFLDHELLEYMAALESRYKMRGLTLKWLLKRIARDLLPREILTARKRGFGLPIDVWMLRDLWPAASRVLLSDTALARGYFRADGLKLLLEQTKRRHFRAAQHVWTLLLLELWHRVFIDQVPRKPGTEILS